MLDIDCLAQAVYYEARTESRAGQYAVARVVINRAKKKRSLCSVVYEPRQFSWTSRAQAAPYGRAWIIAQEEASKALDGPDTVGGATHFHNHTVRPGWSRTLKFIIRIGSHSFYR